MPGYAHGDVEGECIPAFHRMGLREGSNSGHIRLGSNYLGPLSHLASLTTDNVPGFSELQFL